MSLNETLIKSVKNTIDIFIDRVAKKYALDKTELTTLWSGKSTPPPKKDSIVHFDTTDLSEGRLLKCTRAELVALCKSHGHKCGGTKPVLLGRLLGRDDVVPAPRKKKTPPKKTKSFQSDIVKKLTADVKHIAIRRNQFNNHEHPETGLVFDKKTKKVVGKQQDDGTLSELTSEDIDQCKKFKFEYQIPDNLDRNNNNENEDTELKELEEELSEDEVALEEDDENIEMVLGDEDDEDEDVEEEVEYYEED